MKTVKTHRVYQHCFPVTLPQEIYHWHLKCISGILCLWNAREIQGDQRNSHYCFFLHQKLSFSCWDKGQWGLIYWSSHRQISGSSSLLDHQLLLLILLHIFVLSFICLSIYLLSLGFNIKPWLVWSCNVYQVGFQHAVIWSLSSACIHLELQVGHHHTCVQLELQGCANITPVSSLRWWLLKLWNVFLHEVT